MEQLKLVSFVCLSLTQIVAIFPALYIRRYISQKPPAAQTLIDLIYRDCIAFNYFVEFFYSLGILGCLASPDNVLAFVPAFVFAAGASLFVFLFTVSLFISGLLRLLTLVTRSEEAGLQLLGPDDVAIRVVRMIASTFSVTFLLTLIGGYQILPGPFYIFYHDQNLSVQSFEKLVPGTNIYFVPAVFAAVVNILCKMFSLFLKLETEFSFSLSGAILFSFAMLIMAGSSFVGRRIRIVIVYPMLMFSFLVLIATYIIVTNDKMRKKLKADLVTGFEKVFSCLIPKYGPFKKASRVHPELP